jgi:hypothetical protein
MYKISFFKKLPLFIFLLLSISFELYSQEYGDYFGNYFSGFKYFKYKGLYAKLDLEQGGPELKNKVFVSIPKNIKDFDLLAGDLSKYENRVFKIDSIFDFKEDKDVGESKIFRLKEISTNTEIYYIYDIYARESHYLLTEFGKGDFDSYEEKEISREVDDFTGEIRINSPSLSDLGSITKNILDGKSIYYFSSSIISQGIYRGKGVYILFTDGTKWSRPNEVVDLGYNSEGFQNKVFLRLTLSDLEIFKKKVIKKIRLYIHDKDVDLAEAENFRKLVNLIIKKR